MTTPPLPDQSDAPPVEVGRDTRHERLSNPDLWGRMTDGERAAYNAGWLQATLNMMAPSHGVARDETQASGSDKQI